MKILQSAAVASVSATVVFSAAAADDDEIVCDLFSTDGSKDF